MLFYYIFLSSWISSFFIQHIGSIDNKQLTVSNLYNILINSTGKTKGYSCVLTGLLKALPV